MKQQKNQFNPFKANSTWKKTSWIFIVPIVLCFILMPVLIFTGHGEWSFLVFWIAFGFTVVFIIISWIFRFKMALKMKGATPPVNPTSTPNHTMATYQNQERKSLREQQNDYLARQEKYHDADEHRMGVDVLFEVVHRGLLYVAKIAYAQCGATYRHIDGEHLS